MSETTYRPDDPLSEINAMIWLGSGPDPLFDPFMQDLLRESDLDLARQCKRGGLLRVVRLGKSNYRTSFQWRPTATT